MIKAIIFDFDGTIADSFDVAIEVFHHLLKKQRLNKDEINQLRGLPTKEVLRRMGVKPWQLPWLVARARKEMNEGIALVRPFDDLALSLAKLQSEEYKLFIISTNSKSNIDKFLKINDLDKFIHDVTGSVGLFGKAPVLKAFKKRYAYTNQEVVYVGDETRDIVAAKKAEMRCIAAAWGFNTIEILKTYDPDGIVNQPKGLLTAIKLLEK